MNLKLNHIIIIITSILITACATDNRKVKSVNENFEVATEEVDDMTIISDLEVLPNFNKSLVSQKLQDFYDLIELQNQHPEFTNEVTKQLKNYTNESIESFTYNEPVIIENIKQLGNTIIVNDSTQKIKIAYTKAIKNIKIIDTIFAIITEKAVIIDDETLVSNKILFSKE